MKFTRTVTVTHVQRKIALKGVGLRCARCGYEMAAGGEAEGAEKRRKLAPPADRDKGGATK